MKNPEYFNTLLKLYEATSAADVDKYQEQVADTGSDVNDSNVLPNGNQPNEVQMSQESQPENAPEENGENPDGLDDAAYLNDPNQDPASFTQTKDSKKLVKIFELMQNLLNYSDTLGTTLDNVELGLLDSSDLETANKYRKSLDELKSKVHDYLMDVFEYNNYEKNVYAYVLFRTELLTIVKNIRNSLKLNEVKED